jgi:hypothetical protein
VRRRIILAAVMTAVLSMPSAALAADQDVDVQVLPANALGIAVQEGLGFAIQLGGSATQPFMMNITNTTSGGWIVTVDGPDLQSYSWEYCDETGCYNRQPTGNSIPKSNVVVTGADTCWNQCESPAADPRITSYSVALGANPVTIMEGTVDAWGMFGFGPGEDPTVQLTIPAETVYDQYYTTLTYTIMAP